MVARAAPLIPHPNTKMAVGSRTTLSARPTRVESMVSCELPPARVTKFMALVNMKKGIPGMRYKKYSLAYLMLFSITPSPYKILSLKKAYSRVRAIPEAVIKATVLPTLLYTYSPSLHPWQILR